VTTIKGLYNRINNLDTNKVIVDSLEATKDSIADFNAEQLHHGLRSDGEEIGPDYASDAYAAMKNRMNPLPGAGVPDLYATGSFVQNIKVDVGSDKITTESSDDKSPMLQKKYKKIFGLSKPYKREYLNESLRPTFKKNMEKATGLKLS
jgi:hypothetical protein